MAYSDDKAEILIRLPKKVRKLVKRQKHKNGFSLFLIRFKKKTYLCQIVHNPINNYFA
jgi:hypothetical protein